jgi:hypothetical protein
MGTELALVPIQLPTNPAQLPSLPAWLQRRSAALGSALQPDSSGRHREMTTLPKDLILNSSEHAEVQHHIADLERYTRLDQLITIRESQMGNDTAIGVMVAGLLIKGGGQKLDKASADSLTEDYLDALEDIPAWCVREALRKWNRGESLPLDGKRHDFNWKPSPPTLRRLAQNELAGVKGRIISLQKLCEAVPLIEFSDDHREMMLKRLQVVIRAAATPAPVNMEPGALNSTMTGPVDEMIETGTMTNPVQDRNLPDKWDRVETAEMPAREGVEQ